MLVKAFAAASPAVDCEAAPAVGDAIGRSWLARAATSPSGRSWKAHLQATWGPRRPLLRKLTVDVASHEFAAEAELSAAGVKPGRAASVMDPGKTARPSFVAAGAVGPDEQVGRPRHVSHV